MSQNQTSWTKLNFIERTSIPIMEMPLMGADAIKWLEFEATDPNAQWIFDCNVETMEFGGVFHSIYLRWCVTINGLYKAAEYYGSEEWHKAGKGFTVAGLRNAPDGSGPATQAVQLWTGTKAAEVHKTTAPMIAAWAFCNMYASLEEFIFRIYRVFLESHPMDICGGDDFKLLRRQFRNKDSSAAASKEWMEAWTARLEAWHRKKLYDGLGKVFASYVTRSRLVVPIQFEGKFTYQNYADTLTGISIIRNSFMHGATKVSADLAEFSRKTTGGFFDFKEGESFSIELKHLAALEYFTDNFTVNLNTSFVELAKPEIREMTKEVLSGKA